MRATWDEVGKKYYETGVDRAMLYKLKDNSYPSGVPWSGITSVEESPSGAESNAFYADNIKYFNLTSAEEYADKLVLKLMIYLQGTWCDLKQPWK